LILFLIGKVYNWDFSSTITSPPASVPLSHPFRRRSNERAKWGNQIYSNEKLKYHIFRLVRYGAKQAFNYTSLHVFLGGLHTSLQNKLLSSRAQTLNAAFREALAFEKYELEKQQRNAVAPPRKVIGFCLFIDLVIFLVKFITFSC